MEGAILGFLPGLIAGLALKRGLEGQDACQTGCSWLVVAGPAVGVELIGILLGAAIGHRTTVAFVDAPAAPVVPPPR